MVLPAPLGPSSATRSPRVDVQVDAVQGLVAVGVGVGQPADVEDRDAHGSVRPGRQPRETIARWTRSPRS